MPVKDGVVTRVIAEKAWVTVERDDACHSCPERDSCGMSLLEQGKSVNVEAVNSAGAHVGDRVSVSMTPGAVAMLSFFLYFFPVLTMLITAFAGDMAAHAMDLDTVIIPAICGFLGLAGAIVVMRRIAGRMEKRPRFRPRVVAVVKDASSESTVPPV